MLANTSILCDNEVYRLREKRMKGFKYRLAIKLVNMGIKLRWVWLIDFGNKLKRESMSNYV